MIEYDKIREMQQRNQAACFHRSSSEMWAISLQHNFPDRYPRGICLLCHLLIHPREWRCGEPNQMVVVAAHPLYPIVVALEIEDAERAIQQDKYIAEVDSALFRGDMRAIGLIEMQNWQAQSEIHARCEQATASFVRGRAGK